MKEFLRFRALLYELTVRDIKVKYRRSILGLLWTVLNPLLMMLVLCFVFSKLFRFGIENYAIYVLSGQVIFNFYQMSTSDAMVAILNNGALIKKIYVPKYMLVLVKILSGTVYLLASFVALLVVMLVTGSKITGPVFLVVPIFLNLIILSLGVGLILAAVTVRFRDIMHLYGVFCTALFYLTPVIYPFSILPDYIQWVIYYNPLTAITEVFRAVVLEGQLPDMGRMLYGFVSAVIMLLIGSTVFGKRQKTFILDL